RGSLRTHSRAQDLEEEKRVRVDLREAAPVRLASIDGVDALGVGDRVQAARFFTRTSTTGHHVDWNASWSSITKLWPGRTTSCSFCDPKTRDRSIVRG